MKLIHGNQGDHAASHNITKRTYYMYMAVRKYESVFSSVANISHEWAKQTKKTLICVSEQPLTNTRTVDI